jgi:hypothetical protein
MPSTFGRALIETLPTPLLVVSRNGKVGYANQAAQAALPRLQAGAHFAHLIRAPAFVEAVGATLADGAERRVRFAAELGRERHFEARVALLPPGGAFGPEAQAIVQIEDRTDTRTSSPTPATSSGPRSPRSSATSRPCSTTPATTRRRASASSGSWDARPRGCSGWSTT